MPTQFIDIGPRQKSTLDIGPRQSAGSTPINVTLSDSQIGNWADAIASALQDAVNINVVLSDSFSFTDAITFDMFVSHIALSDSLSLSDSISFNVLPVILTETLSDTFAFSDSLTIVLQLVTPDDLLSDVLSLTDFVQLMLASAFTISDTLALSDNLQIQLNSTGIILTDSLSLSDDIGLQLNESLEIQLDDTFAFSDMVTNFESTSFISYIRQYLNDVVN